MGKILQLVAVLVGKPILEKVASYLVDYLQAEYETYKMRKKQKKLYEELKKAKGPDEIRAINRKLSL